MTKPEPREYWVDCPQCGGSGSVASLKVRPSLRIPVRPKVRCVLCDGLGIVDALTDAANKAQRDLFDGSEG